MEKLTENQYDLLKHEIYMVLMAGYDSDGEEIGMGEMGNCEDAAHDIVDEWIKKANIELNCTKSRIARFKKG